MKDQDWINLLIFGGGVLAGVMLIAFLPGMPWLNTLQPNDENRELLDLAAQQGMMAAAYWMVAISAIGAIAGLGSLIFLRLNLIEAQNVTREAIRSGDAAESAAKHARFGVAEQSRMAKNQLRAYCVVKSASLMQMGNLLHIDVVVTNSGQSPARSVSVDASLIVGPREWSETLSLGPIFLPDISVGDGEEANFKRRIEEARPASGRWPIHLEGVVKYHDVFRQWHKDEFKFRVTLEGEGQLPLTVMSRQPNAIAPDKPKLFDD